MKPEPIAYVRQIEGEPCRFHVNSASHPAETHLVDIAAHNGQGECDCIRFTTVCGPRIKKTGTLPPSFRCRHIRAARELALNLTIQQFIQEHPQ